MNMALKYRNCYRYIYMIYLVCSTYYVPKGAMCWKGIPRGRSYAAEIQTQILKEYAAEIKILIPKGALGERISR